MSIFTHTNGDGGDSMDVYVTDSGTIEFHTAIHGQYGSSCRVPKEDALRLYAAIGEALYPVHTPEAPNRSLIEQLIDKAVKDAVTAILPLHLAPAATCRAKDCDTARHLTTPVCTIPEHQTDRWGYVGANRPPFDFDDEEAPELCNIPGCMITGMPGTHFAHDPAPTTCANAGEHRPQECPEYDSATEAKQTALAKWEAELRRDAGRSLAVPYCGDCGHSRIRHDSGRCSVRRCLCNWDGKP